jgi:hypothetical protein
MQQYYQQNNKMVEVSQYILTRNNIHILTSSIFK